ncbi:unnamed protein product [Kluyveromyces dobzhanskii CBS 2104]|uniref:WGS project CCBQ000000000 data, contig 00107 n=1 Tax=Kluyveromyces dobzhanskii CBS 2104 TaxID=1427455 RepID=A0A0A8L128_9SACH|nr:unnamed protein product [Kluyveromyces dobzhanskii CBS 2104]
MNRADLNSRTYDARACLVPLPMEPIPWDLSMKNELKPREHRSTTIESTKTYSQTMIYSVDISALSTGQLCECNDITQPLSVPLLLPAGHLGSGVSTPISEGAIAANSTTNDDQSFADASRYGSDTVVTSPLIETVKEGSFVQRSVNYKSQCQA